MKVYVTFGQAHVHRIHGKIFDGNYIAVIECSSPQEGRQLTRAYFGSSYCFEYTEEELDKIDMRFFPRGFIAVNQDTVHEHTRQF